MIEPNVRAQEMARECVARMHPIDNALNTEAQIEHVAIYIAAAAADARRQAIEECAPRWQPIDTAPKSTHEGEYVRGIYLLGYCPEEGIRPDACICVIWWEPLQNGGEWVNEAGASVRPTHWQPLPPAPEEPQP